MRRMLAPQLPDETPQIVTAVDDLVYGVFRDVADVVQATGFTRQTVWYWLGRKVIGKTKTARYLEAKSRERGRAIPAEALMGLMLWTPGDDGDKLRGGYRRARLLMKQVDGLIPSSLPESIEGSPAAQARVFHVLHGRGQVRVPEEELHVAGALPAVHQHAGDGVPKRLRAEGPAEDGAAHLAQGGVHGAGAPREPGAGRAEHPRGLRRAA